MYFRRFVVMILIMFAVNTLSGCSFFSWGEDPEKQFDLSEISKDIQRPQPASAEEDGVPEEEIAETIMPTSPVRDIPSRVDGAEPLSEEDQGHTPATAAPCCSFWRRCTAEF